MCPRGQCSAINYLFYQFVNTSVCNFAYDNTPYFCDIDLVSLFANLENDILSALIWFEESHMQLNSIKCHILFMGNIPEYLGVKVGDSQIFGRGYFYHHMIQPFYSMSGF